MASSNQMFVIAFAICACFAVVKCQEDGTINPKAVEEGRTLVHHAMKRLSILLPAFMFKLGIMFTMILVTLIASSKGMIVGTLLLALGVGHFIATRFSAVATPVAAPYALPLPHYPAAHLHSAHLHAAHSLPLHHHILDRSDSVSQGSGNVGSYPAQYQGQYAGQYAQGQAYSAWRQ